MSGREQPLRTIHALAPTRICDLGGWTDTWFAGYGTILNIAIAPYAEVQVKVFDPQDAPRGIKIHAENYNQTLDYRPGVREGQHALLFAAVEIMEPDSELRLEINVFSQAPAGASISTSSAVCVALVGALSLLGEAVLPPYQAAMTAQRVETELLGRQCGIQDQLAAAFGGTNLIEMDAYPHAVVQPLALTPALTWELEQRLILVYLGSGHQSSLIHEKVIQNLEDSGPEDSRLHSLRMLARQGADALLSGDLEAFGEAMIANTLAQAALHPELVSQSAWEAIEVARKHHALGWKVNGAGGDGGSLTILGNGDRQAQRRMAHEISRLNPAYQTIPIHLSPQGLRVWDCQGNHVILKEYD